MTMKLPLAESTGQNKCSNLNVTIAISYSPSNKYIKFNCRKCCKDGAPPVSL